VVLFLDLVVVSADDLNVCVVQAQSAAAAAEASALESSKHARLSHTIAALSAAQAAAQSFNMVRCVPSKLLLRILTRSDGVLQSESVTQWGTR